MLLLYCDGFLALSSSQYAVNKNYFPHAVYRCTQTVAVYIFKMISICFTAVNTQIFISNHDAFEIYIQ